MAAGAIRARLCNFAGRRENRSAGSFVRISFGLSPIDRFARGSLDAALPTFAPEVSGHRGVAARLEPSIERSTRELAN